MDHLDSLLLSELKKIAKAINMEEISKYKKNELVEEITKKTTIDSNGVGWGSLDVLADGYGFLRETNVDKDIYISASQIRKFNLRTGDTVIGEIRTPLEDEKNYALKKLILVNWNSLQKAIDRVPFDELTPSYATEQIILETNNKNISGRIIDLIAPIGKGQRGVIVAPPKAGKTVLISSIANSIVKNHPDIEVWILLIDERPEEVTDIREVVQNATVFASTFDEDPRNHTKVTEKVLEMAKRKVEDGGDIVILMDSLTRLARAYNIVIPSSGKLISGGIDPTALYYPKKFFGSARNIHNGGSLTIIATALIDTGSKMDEVIYEEFKGTGNMDLYLDRNLSELRIFPAIDVKKSGTRKEELLLNTENLDLIWSIRRYLSKFDIAESSRKLISIISSTKNNKELLKRYEKGENKNAK